MTDPHANYLAAVQALKNRDDPLRGLAFLRLAAGQGVPDAVVLLGQILWCSAGSREEGIGYLCAASQAGNAQALYLLGLAHFRGQGVTLDLAAARRFQLRAAKLGHADAQFELSLLLEQGIGGEVESAGARRWELAAAKGCHPRACLNRGSRLARAKRPQWAEVAQWYARAAAAGNVEAAARLRAMAMAGSETSTQESRPAIANGPTFDQQPPTQPTPRLRRGSRWSTLLATAPAFATSAPERTPHSASLAALPNDPHR